MTRPDNSWTLAQLENYAHDRASNISSFGRKTLTETWLFGESLFFVEEQTKAAGTWLAWVKAQGYSLPTASNAIKLYQRIPYGDLDSFDDMTVTDVKIMLGLIKRPPVKRPPVETVETVDVESETLLESEPVGKTESGPAPHKVTTTDQRKAKIVNVSGVSLSVSEVLGKALNLVVEAQKIGVDSSCDDILRQITTLASSLLSLQISA